VIHRIVTGVHMIQVNVVAREIVMVTEPQEGRQELADQHRSSH
jgi:hypothetical protein